MAHVKFASKTCDGMEEYKKKLMNWVKYCIQLWIIESDIWLRFVNNIEKVLNYIPREDVMNLEDNCRIIENNIELLKQIKKDIIKIDINKNITEKIFEIISQIDDLIKTHLEEEKTNERLNKINEMKEKQDLENKKELNELEKLLDTL